MQDIDFIISEIDKAFSNCNIISEGVNSLKSFREKAKSLILSEIDNKTVISQIREQETQAKIDYFYYKTQKKYYYRYFVFAALRDSFQHEKIKPFSFKKEWLEVIKLLEKSYSKIYDFELEVPSRESLIAKVLKGLYLGKYNFNYKNGKVVLDDHKVIRCAKDIENLIVELGALNVLIKLFQYLGTTQYDNKLCRYVFYRKYIDYGKELKPDFPINYLIQICLKHLKDNKNVSKFPDRRFRKLINLSTEFLYLYDLQDFFRVTPLWFPQNYDKDFLYRNLLHDNIFSFHQGCSRRIIRTLKPLLECNKEMFAEKMGCTYDDFFDFIAKLYSIVNKNGPSLINKSGFSQSELELITKLSHTQTVNEKFLLPTDFNKSQNPYFKKPFIDCGDKFLLIDKCYSFWAFYEAILQQLNYKINVGKNLEIILINYLKSKNFKIHFGRYANSGNRECDIVIEENDAIIFCELKKKTITQKSLEGDKEQILVDLEESFLSSSEQLLFHEIFIRKNQRMIFDDINSSQSVLDYKDRDIIRISISIFDLQIFNNHSVSMMLFDYLRSCNFNIIGDTNNKEYRKLEKEIKMINDNVNSVNHILEVLQNEFGIDLREHNFRHHFLSLELFIFFIDKAVSSKMSLSRVLSVVQAASLSSGNVYFEFNYLNSILNNY